MRKPRRCCWNRPVKGGTDSAPLTPTPAPGRLGTHAPGVCDFGATYPVKAEVHSTTLFLGRLKVPHTVSHTEIRNELRRTVDTPLPPGRSPLSRYRRIRSPLSRFRDWNDRIRRKVYNTNYPRKFASQLGVGAEYEIFTDRGFCSNWLGGRAQYWRQSKNSIPM